MSRQVTHIVVHCSASQNGQHVTPAAIDSWHADRGFMRQPAARKALNPELSSIGYHYVIDVKGITHSGRGLEEIGAHVQGSNAKSIGVCMVGTDKFTPGQWNALSVVIRTLRALYPDAVVCGHRDFSPDKDGDGVVEPWEWIKTCPGFDVAGWVERGYQPAEENVL